MLLLWQLVPLKRGNTQTSGGKKMDKENMGEAGKSGREERTFTQ